jgi:hypothetical protein
MPRLFNALTGEELKKVILAAVERKLESDHRFRANITYPILKFDLQFKLECYPLDPPLAEIHLGESYEAPLELEAQLGEKQTLEFGLRADVDAPDALREGFGLPVPKPRVGPGGQIVDI